MTQKDIKLPPAKEPLIDEDKKAEREKILSYMRNGDELLFQKWVNGSASQNLTSELIAVLFNKHDKDLNNVITTVVKRKLEDNAPKDKYKTKSNVKRRIHKFKQYLEELEINLEEESDLISKADIIADLAQASDDISEALLLSNITEAKTAMKNLSIGMANSEIKSVVIENLFILANSFLRMANGDGFIEQRSCDIVFDEDKKKFEIAREAFQEGGKSGSTLNPMTAGKKKISIVRKSREPDPRAYQTFCDIFVKIEKIRSSQNHNIATNEETYKSKLTYLEKVKTEKEIMKERATKIRNNEIDIGD